MIKRRLSPGWSVTSEPLTAGKMRMTSHGCLHIELKLKGASANTPYRVGFDVHGADLPCFGGLIRSSVHTGSPHVSGSSNSIVNGFIMGTAATDHRGRTAFKALLPVAPGVYNIQLWLAKVSDGDRERQVCYQTGEAFGDCDTVTITESSYAPYMSEPHPLQDCGRRVFLDVGANNGQTLAAVLDPSYRFDTIDCFEPASACWPELARVGDPRVFVNPFGLWNKTCARPLFNSGHQSGSIFQELNNAENREMCRFVRASDWFRANLAPDDVVFMKLNCEGAECDIVDDLLETDEFRKVAFVMIDFDVRKIPSQRHREPEIKRKLERFGFPRVAFRNQVMVGLTQVEKIQNWLHLVGAGNRTPPHPDGPRFLVNDFTW